MNKVKNAYILIGSILVVLFMDGCAPVRQPVMVDPLLLEQQPETISILPAIDARRDRESVKINDLDKTIQPKIKLSLQEYKYKTVIESNYAVDHPEGYLAEMTDDELITLAPQNAEAAFLYVLDDLTEHNRIISNSARIVCRAYLIDPVKKKIIWKDESSCSPYAGGLAYAFISMKNEAIMRSLGELMQSLPKRGSKPK